MRLVRLNIQSFRETRHHSGNSILNDSAWCLLHVSLSWLRFWYGSGIPRFRTGERVLLVMRKPSPCRATPPPRGPGTTKGAFGFRYGPRECTMAHKPKPRAGYGSARGHHEGPPDPQIGGCYTALGGGPAGSWAACFRKAREVRSGFIGEAKGLPGHPGAAEVAVCLRHWPSSKAQHP